MTFTPEELALIANALRAWATCPRSDRDTVYQILNRIEHPSGQRQ